MRKRKIGIRREQPIYRKIALISWVYKKCGPAAQSKMRPRLVISKNGPGRILPGPHFSLFLELIL